jgi:hypothetical protein
MRPVIPIAVQALVVTLGRHDTVAAISRFHACN